jgi:cytokinin dehydrogenase
MQHPCGDRQPSRRRFLQTLARSALVLGFDPLRRAWVTPAQASSGVAFDTLPRLDGTLHLEDAALAAAAQDFGRLVQERPLAVLQPGSVRDIRRIVAFAQRQGVRLAVRGHGHALYGQTQVAGGIVIDMQSLAHVHVVHDRVIADAGSSWRAVLEATLRAGLTPPVLLNYLGLSVGGTLSIGGISPTTARYGAQVDNVLELDVVTGDGREVRCSDTQHADLFNAALAGQGQCAIITRAVLRLVPAPARVRRFVLRYADLATALADAERLTEDGRFAGVVLVVGPTAQGEREQVLHGTTYYAFPEEPDPARLLAGLQYLPGGMQIQDVSYWQYANELVGPFPPLAHPAIGLLVPGAAAPQYLETALGAMTPDALGAFQAVRLFALRRRPFTRPLLRVPDAERFLYMAALRRAADATAATRMVAGNRTLYEWARNVGGTLYPFSALLLSPEEWRQHYGPHWDALAHAKRRYDPANVLASGPDLFGS